DGALATVALTTKRTRDTMRKLLDPDWGRYQVRKVGQRIQWRIEGQQLTHAVHVRDETRHVHGSRRLEFDMGLAGGESSDSPRQVHHTGSGATRDIRCGQRTIQSGSADHGFDDLVNPHHVDNLFAAVHLNLLAGDGLFNPERNDPTKVA